MSCAVSHRCSTIVMQRMFCQRSTLRVALQWWGTPKIPVITSGCHCVLSLCHLKYCHLPKSLTMAYEKIHKIPIPPNYHQSWHSRVRMAHWKSSNNFPSSLFFHSLCIRSSLHSTPCRPHWPFPGPLAFVVRSIHGGARGDELLHSGSLAVASRPVQRCPTSGAEGLRDVNGWRAPPRGSPPPNPGCSGRNCNL